jgi:hypothetical protein
MMSAGGCTLGSFARLRMTVVGVCFLFHAFRGYTLIQTALMLRLTATLHEDLRPIGSGFGLRGVG